MTMVLPVPSLVAAQSRYQRARARANIASRRFVADLPRVEIACGRAMNWPRHAYSEEEIDATWGQLLHHWWQGPGLVRDAIEQGYKERIAEFRAKKAAYDYEYEACGYAAADRELDTAARYLDSLQLFP